MEVKTRRYTINAWQDNNICKFITQGECANVDGNTINGKYVEFQLCDEQNILNLSSIDEIYYNGINANGEQIACDTVIVVDANKGLVRLPISLTMTSKVGDVKGEIVLVKNTIQEDNSVLTESIKFYGINFKVQASHNGSSIMATPQFSQLEKLINYVKAALKVEGDIDISKYVIDDTQETADKTYSSVKLQNLLDEKIDSISIRGADITSEPTALTNIQKEGTTLVLYFTSLLNDDTPSDTTTFSGNKINELLSDLFSSEELQQELSKKADKATTLNGYGITDAYTKQDIDEKISTINTELVANYGCKLFFDEITNTLSLQNSNDEILGDTVTIKAGIDGITMGTELDESDNTYYLVLFDEGGAELARTPLPATGGGGSATTTLKLRNLLDSNSLIIPYTDDDTNISCILKYSFSSIDSTGETTGNGTAVYYVNNQQVYAGTIQQGEITFDIGGYLKQGKTNTVKVTVTDSEDNKRSLSYSVTTTINKITSTFPLISKQTDSFSVPYTPVGVGTKTVHFVVDDTEVATKTVTTSNREQFQTFSLTHGSHIVKIYMTTLIDGYSEEVVSNTLQFGVVYCESGNTTPILLVEPIANTEILQFSQVTINFMVFAGDNTDNKVSCYVDNENTTSLSVIEGVNTWKHRITTSGEHTLKLVFGDLSEEITFNASAVEVAEAETSGLKFYLNTYNRSNSEENPSQYSYQNEDGETFDVTFNNIKFIDGLDGWTGNSLLIPLGSSIDIAYKPFEDDVTTTNGKTFEINFKVSDVYDYETNVISCYANDKGIYITPNNGTLAINTNNVVDVQFADNEDIKITVVISRRNTANEGQRQLIYIYANGIISGILKYSVNDSFSQVNADTVHIGSDSASVEVYNARFYNVELSSYQVLDNFIADAKDPEEMIERNIRNQIFNQDNMVDYDLLPKETPYLIIRCSELPQYKGDKKTGVSGEFVDKANPEKSFTFEGAEFDVQGTSSAGYYVKNFKGKFKGGFTVNGEHTDAYAIEDNDLPVSTFCFKADVASSEGANNICLMKLWEETTPYKTDIQKSDSRVRQAINGRPMVLYWENPETGEISFRGKYNFNNDKSTQNTFGFSEGCECWEFKDNGLALTEFSGDDFSEWENAFEARYPDGYTDTTKLQRVVSWVVSTDPNQATNNSLSSPVTYGDTTYNKDTAEYRLAKFKNEFENYFVKTPVLYYYIYTDLFLMVDSRAKNQFLTTYDGEHWMFIPYDGDTALGIDNVGKLKFGYWLEDTDKVNGQDVYNGQQSVLWNNVRKVFGEDIKKIAQTVISEGKLNCEYVKNFFNKHQSAWSEAVFCADTAVKYIDPYLKEGTLVYLDMAQGSKRSQRDCWLRDRFQYWNSKYNVGTSKDSYITLRVSQPTTSTVDVVEPNTDMHITPYKNTYINISFGQSEKQEKGIANQVSNITSTLDNPRDTPIYIYNAENIKSLGDLSCAYVGYCNIASATNLESIVLGSSKDGYFNEALTTVGLGNNTKLKLIDVRNCTNLSGEINASGCNNVEEIYADGTQVTSVVLSNSGRLKTLSLPSTINSLILKEQTALDNFSIASYDNVKTLVIKNCSNLDSLDIVSKCSNLTNVTLTNVDWALDSTDILDKLADLGGVNDDNTTSKQSVLTGTVHLPSINTEKYNKYTSLWKNLTITYDKFIKQYPVSFQDWDGTVLFTEYVDDGSYAYDPVASGDIETPTRESDVTTVYTYDGWNMDLSTISIRTVTTVIAIYSTVTRQYTVTFMNGLDILQQTTVDVFGSVSYSANTPTKDNTTDTYYLFKEWLSSDWDKTYNEESANVWDNDTYTVSNIISDITITTELTKCQVPDFPRMYLDKDKLAQGIREGVYEKVDGVKVGVPQYDYLYTNDPKYTSCYTLEEFYAICKSDIFNTPYKLDSTGVEHCYTEIGDKIRIKLDSAQVIGGDPYGLGYGTIICEIYGYNAYELEDSSDFGEYAGQEILAKFADESELAGKDSGLYLNSKNGYAYYWNGETLSDKINQVMSHIVFGLQMADSLATSNADKVYGHLIDIAHQMNTSNTNAYGWGDDSTNYKCKMNRWLNDGYSGSNNGNSVLSYLPRAIQQIISPVKVRSSKGNVTESGTTIFYVTPVTSVCSLFLFAYGELWGTSDTPYLNEMSKWSSLVTLDDSGNPKSISRYTGIVNNNCNIRKPYLGTGDMSSWWTRSPASASSLFIRVTSSNGNASSSGSSVNAIGVAFGFNIG